MPGWPAPLRHQHLLEGIEVLNASARAEHDRLQRIAGQVDRHPCLFAQPLIKAAQQGTTAGERDTADLPVAADLEKGFGDGPDAAAETIRQAGAIGLVGGSIEDATGNKDKPLYDIKTATERVAAAVKAARALSIPFVLTARAEGFLRGQPDLDDVIKRLQSFEAAGADVLFAPGLPDLAAVKKVCGSLKKPFNFMVGIKGKSFSKAELEAAGVKRISLATSLYRAAMTGLLEAAKEVKDKGTFTYLDHSIPTPELNAFMKE